MDEGISFVIPEYSNFPNYLSMVIQGWDINAGKLYYQFIPPSYRNIPSKVIAHANLDYIYCIDITSGNSYVKYKYDSNSLIEGQTVLIISEEYILFSKAYPDAESGFVYYNVNLREEYQLSELGFDSRTQWIQPIK